MPSNKEILEAQRYNRKRLVTAFSSGTPGGRELESKSSFTPLIVGVVIVVIMMGVGAIMGRFSPTLPDNWQSSTLIVVKGTGARYFTIDGVMRPVTNVTSARLLSEAGQYQTSEVASSTVEGIPRGTPIGLTGVPDDVPPTDRLHSDQWFSCAVLDTTHTWVAQVPSKHAARGSALVQNGDSLFLIANGLRHEIPQEDRKTVLLSLGLESTAPVHVTAAWLALFDLGSELKPWELEDSGLPASDMPPELGFVTIGSVIEVPDNNSTRRYVVTDFDTVTPLSDTAARLYQGGQSLQSSVAEMSTVNIDLDNSVSPSDWPREITDMISSDSLPCAQLGQTATGAPIAELHSVDKVWLANSLSTNTDADADVDEKLASIPQITSVLGGSGALVRGTSGGSLGTVMLVSDLGTIHGLGTDSAPALERFGYSDSDLFQIPAPWLALIPEGTSLNPAEAWKTVAQR